MDIFGTLLQMQKAVGLTQNVYTETENGFDVSYLPDQKSTHAMDMTQLPIDQDETALIIEGEPMRILNGDFQEQYLACNTVDEAIAVFDANKDEHLNPYSEV